jgi:hypothetical protein
MCHPCRGLDTRTFFTKSPKARMAWATKFELVSPLVLLRVGLVGRSASEKAELNAGSEKKLVMQDFAILSSLGLSLVTEFAE